MLAEAALADTLEAGQPVPRSPGTSWPWPTRGPTAALRAELPGRYEVSPQRGQGLDERIAAAFDDAYAQLAVPIVLIGMDTPQVTPGLLETVAQPLSSGEADAVFGPAADGGFWLLGLRKPDPQLILGVPMSVDHTGRVQLDRLRAARACGSGRSLSSSTWTRSRMRSRCCLPGGNQAAGSLPRWASPCTSGGHGSRRWSSTGQASSARRPAAAVGLRGLAPKGAQAPTGLQERGSESEEARNERPERRGKEAPPRPRRRKNG